MRVIQLIGQDNQLVGKQVFLRTHVRVEPNWTKNERSMRKLGYSKSK